MRANVDQILEQLQGEWDHWNAEFWRCAIEDEDGFIKLRDCVEEIKQAALNYKTMLDEMGV